MRRVSDEKARYVAEHFATTSNAEIIRATGLSIPAIYRIAKDAGVTRSDEYRAKALGKIVLTEEMKAELTERFPDEDNYTLAADLGISESTLHRFARALGLKKTREYMRQCNRESLSAMQYANRKNGHWPQKGVYPENLWKGREYQFKPGMNNLQRNGKANEQRRLRKSIASRAETVRIEQARVNAGLPPRTKLRLRVKDGNLGA